MRRALVLLALVVGLAGLVGCRGDQKQCEEACRNFAKLVYWKQLDAEIAKLPEAEQDARRRRGLAEYSSLVEDGVVGCVSQCVSAGNDDQTACLIKATTAAVAEACVK